MLPPQVEDALGSSAITMPLGREVEKVMSVAATWLLRLSMTNARVLVPFAGMSVGENELVKVGGTGTTLRVSVARKPTKDRPPTTVEMRLVLFS